MLVSYLLLFVMICACLFVVNVSWLEFSVWSCMGIHFVLFVTLQGLLRIHFTAFRYQLHLFSLTIHSDFAFSTLIIRQMDGIFIAQK